MKATDTRTPERNRAPLGRDAAAARRLSLAGLFASTFFELTGLFLYTPLLLFELKRRGLATAHVGWFMALQWAGLLIATPFASGWVRRLGPRGALLTSGALPLVALTGMQLFDALALLAPLYLSAGMASALRWVMSEATLAELAPPERRGRLMGLFAMMIGVTFMVGPALLAAMIGAGWSTANAGWAAVALVALGLALLVPVRPRDSVPAESAHDQAATRAAWRGTLAALRAAPAVMLGGFVGGFFESGLSALLPLYGLSVGFGTALSALLVSASGLGSTLLAVPAGELADRLPRDRVRRGCAAAALAGALLLPLVSAAGPLAWGIAFAWGGSGAALYTLAMVEIGHRHQGVALVEATSVLVLAYTAGGMLAPGLGGWVLQSAPGWGLPLLLAVVATLGLWPMPASAQRPR